MSEYEWWQHRFRRYFKVGPIAVDRVPSWDQPAYPRFGAWWHLKRHGVTLRYRRWLLLVWFGR